MQSGSLETGGGRNWLYLTFLAFVLKSQPRFPLPAWNGSQRSVAMRCNVSGTCHSVHRETCSLCLPCFRPRLVGQATSGEVLKTFSAPQPMPALRALLQAPDSLRAKRSFSVRLCGALFRDVPSWRVLDLLLPATCAMRFCQLWRTRELPAIVLEKHFHPLYLGHFIATYFVPHRNYTRH